MKYWRGYLVAAIVGAFSLALIKFAQAHKELIDMFYPYVTRMVQSFLAQWSSSVELCLWQLGAVVLLVGALASLVLLVIFRWNLIQWLGWVLAVASLGFFLHTGVYGLNYYAGPLAEDIRLQTVSPTLDQLGSATIYFRDQANKLSTVIDRDENAAPKYPDFETLAEQAGEGFRKLTYERFMPVYAGSTLPVKKLGWASMYTSMGITGFTMFLTGEAAVNPQIPVVSLPFTMCHEMAHRMCIASERDANMSAFLACRENPSPEFQYSAYFMAYRYCLSALAAEDPSAAALVAERAGDALQYDLTEYDRFFDIHRDEQATQVATTVNDTYIKTSGDDQGVKSYDDVWYLLVNWYIQELVLPMQEVEEDVFDPLDETQVDLSGIANAKESYDTNVGDAG